MKIRIFCENMLELSYVLYRNLHDPWDIEKYPIEDDEKECKFKPLVDLCKYLGVVD